MQPPKTLIFYRVSMFVGNHHTYFILPSNLPFPSPIGTEIFMACDDDHIIHGFRGAVVTGYEHHTYELKPPKDSLGALYMDLMPGDNERYENRLGSYYIKPACYDELWEMMTAFGWTVENPSPELRKEEDKK